MKTVYIISGPLGVGKTSVSSALSKVLEQTTLVVGDDLYNLEKESDLAWEEKLRKSWERIVALTKKHLDSGQSVVVDFVVEDELPWFMEQLSGKNVHFRYIVLLADKKSVLDRLKNRGELRYKDRSMVLLDQLSKDSSNKKYIIDTTNKEIKEIVQEIINSTRFVVN